MTTSYGHPLIRNCCGAPDVDALIILFERIAHEEGWTTSGKLRQYSAASTHIGCYVDGEAVGGVHCVRGGTLESMPCLAVWPELEGRFGGRDDVADIALLAVRRDHRRHRDGLMWSLCIALFRHCLLSGIDTVLAEVTSARLLSYRAVGLPFETVGHARRHWGEDCYPVAMRVEDAAREVRSRSMSSARYRRIVASAYSAHEPMPVTAEQTLGEAPWSQPVQL